ncbi:hypothetical protein C8J57DRAFT_1223741 [Mycena rebaudengoi]|nr:hypothetical protein C8J57DRAFT_1223741 [Mycena rebaudengoi]
MPPKIWSYLDSFEDLFAYLQNARPVPFWNCLYQVDFHAPLVQRVDESVFTNDNETVFLTTLFGKAMGQNLLTPTAPFVLSGDLKEETPSINYTRPSSLLWLHFSGKTTRRMPNAAIQNTLGSEVAGTGRVASMMEHLPQPSTLLVYAPERYAPVPWGRPQLATGLYAQGNSHAVPSSHGGPLLLASRSQYSVDTDGSSAGPNAHITFRPSPLRNQPSDSLDLRALWENHRKEHTNSDSSLVGVGVAPAVDGAQETAASVALRYHGLASSATGTAPEGLEVHDLSAVQAQLLALNDANAAGNNHYDSTIDLDDVDAAIGDQDVHSDDHLPDFANTPSEVITDSAVQKKLGKRKAGAKDTAVKQARMVGPVGA